MITFLPKLFDRQDKNSILQLFSAFLFGAVILFLSLTLLLLSPKINSAFDALQFESDQATSYAFASKLSRYLEDRELALRDIADSPIMTNAVLLAEGTRPDFRDYTNNARLLGENPELIVLNVKGGILYGADSKSESETAEDFEWALPIMDQDADQLLNLIADETNPQFEMAVPIFYGRGREGILIARFDGRPHAIYDVHMENRELNNESGVSYSKNNVSIQSDMSEIKQPFGHFQMIDKYQLKVTHITSRTRVTQEKSNLIREYIMSVLFAGVLAFALLYFLGRKTIVAPYVKLAKTQEAIAKAVEGIAQIDPTGHYTTLNKAYAGAIGYDPSELIGKNWEITVHPDDLPMLGEAYQTMLDTGQVTVEARGVKKDGSAIYKQVTMISQYNDKGKFIGHHCFMKDISARKIAEKERERLMARLIDSNEELARFAYVCSHDLQEPLRMIRSFSERLQDHIGEDLKDDPKGQKYFSFITDGAARAQELISDILAYSSLDTDSKPLEDIPLNLTVKKIQNALLSAKDDPENMSNEIMTFDNLPIVKGNKTQLHQLFQNLINNGLKYQSEGASPEVHIGVEDKGTEWKFSIRDNGIGIDERHTHKIFDVFQRLHRRTEYAGTGIGLAICKKIVSRHGGEIWVESIKGQGSTFYFTLLKSDIKENSHAHIQAS